MPNKTYGQLCPLARGLDVLGDRWTLLLIREFLLGPKRFKELLATLPAMGTNRLSERLAMLVENAVIQQTPQAGTAYALTPLGEQLRKPVLALALWGLGLPADPRADPTTARAELIVLGLSAAVDPAQIADLQECYAFEVSAEVGTEVFHVQVGGGAVLPRSGPSSGPADVKIHCDIDTFQRLVMGKITPALALEEGAAHLLHGDKKTFERVFNIFQYRA